MSSAQMIKRIRNFLLCTVLRPDSADDNHIKALGKTFLFQSVSFSDQSAQMMANHTVSDFLADRNADSVLFQMIFQNIHDKIFICN